MVLIDCCARGETWKRDANVEFLVTFGKKEGTEEIPTQTHQSLPVLLFLFLFLSPITFLYKLTLIPSPDETKEKVRIEKRALFISIACPSKDTIFFFSGHFHDSLPIQTDYTCPFLNHK